MRTPAGKECKFYYADYYRGNETQECRLIARNPEGGRWRPGLCSRCPVPDILQRNACEHLVIEARVQRSMLGLQDRVKVYAVCSKHLVEVARPEVGCGHCHEVLNLWQG